MKAYWRELPKNEVNKNKRRIVVEMETKEEHNEFHEGCGNHHTTYHIHEGEEGMKHGGIGIILESYKGV